MRDDHYRSFCDYTPEYDGLIDIIKAVNPTASSDNIYGDAEEFASCVVNNCIRSVIFGDAGVWSATGGAMASRVSANPESPSHRKVVLTFSAVATLSKHIVLMAEKAKSHDDTQAQLAAMGYDE